MATGRSSFAKRQRDMAKKAKAAAKRERKLEDDVEVEDDDEIVEDTGPKLSNDEIMEKVADLHRRYDDGQMDLDSFDDERANLMAQISID
ncbi:MAG: hypothetical protein HOH36_14170 [Acidimicrobiaceae bacterium]|jgi:hypothetical protein|nr:hypothetical protein [Acidimicrobiaceae bacterium]MBT5579877.1 hypothetical protein [Acidimicrobiaceae bacterium]MBT5851576.1 hypothetical protein [Acidimicrobiaceae bacterium]MDG1412334.1 hypothetical protein [Acidimicrobiales bacterium]MDG2219090.1 hypothetical protein [Acidimicrobiales bacterium]